MYYIETLKDTEFDRYVASMTGSAVVGRALDEGVYRFQDEATCERVAKLINRSYGGGVFNLVAARTDGKTTEKKDEGVASKSAKKVEKREPAPRDTLSAIDRLVKNMANATKTAAAPMTQQPTQPQQTDFDDIKAVIGMTKTKTTTKKVESKEQPIEVDEAEMDALFNAQYELSEDGVLDVAPAKPFARSQRW